MHTFIYKYTSICSYNIYNEVCRVYTVEVRQQFVADVWFSFFFFFPLYNTNQTIRISSRSQESLLVRKRTWRLTTNTTYKSWMTHPNQPANYCGGSAVLSVQTTSNVYARAGTRNTNLSYNIFVLMRYVFLTTVVGTWCLINKILHLHNILHYYFTHALPVVAWINSGLLSNYIQDRA